MADRGHRRKFRGGPVHKAPAPEPPHGPANGQKKQSAGYVSKSPVGKDSDGRSLYLYRDAAGRLRLVSIGVDGKPAWSKVTIQLPDYEHLKLAQEVAPGAAGAMIGGILGAMFGGGAGVVVGALIGGILGESGRRAKSA